MNKLCIICKHTPCYVKSPCITHQGILTKSEIEELDAKYPDNNTIIGPDTLLFCWQKARLNKDWIRADEIKVEGGALGFKVAFCGTHYEIH
ncbi:MAG: hypothetical protein V4438_04390 [Patescibacteria group bacterium]